jgi:hypothetical protein
MNGDRWGVKGGGGGAGRGGGGTYRPSSALFGVLLAMERLAAIPGQRPKTWIYKCGAYYFHKEKRLANGDWVYHCILKKDKDKKCTARAVSTVLGVDLRPGPLSKFCHHTHEPCASLGPYIPPPQEGSSG